jgi:hypothetical protein
MDIIGVMLPHLVHALIVSMDHQKILVQEQ